MSSSDAIPTVQAWTDGACKGNPGPGGYGVILRHEPTGKSRQLAGAAPQTTNNQMELLAVIHALKALKQPCTVTIHTDSNYVARAWANYIDQWQASGWKTASHKPVKNADLWKELVTAAKPHTVTIVWVKGHAQNAENAQADELASKAAAHCAATGQTGPWSQVA